MRRFAGFLLVFMLTAFVALTALAQPNRNNNPWSYGPNSRWDPSWNSRANPSRGACFFTDAGFRGNRFCVNRGDRLNGLPGNFGDNISSIQTFGGARVRIFNDRNFRGGSASIDRSVPDLRQYRFRGGHTWNNRVSSVQVY